MTEELWKHVFICFYPDLSERSGLEKKQNQLVSRGNIHQVLFVI